MVRWWGLFGLVVGSVWSGGGDCVVLLVQCGQVVGTVLSCCKDSVVRWWGLFGLVVGTVWSGGGDCLVLL